MKDDFTMPSQGISRCQRQQMWTLVLCKPAHEAFLFSFSSFSFSSSSSCVQVLFKFVENFISVTV